MAVERCSQSAHEFRRGCIPGVEPTQALTCQLSQFVMLAQQPRPVLSACKRPEQPLFIVEVCFDLIPPGSAELFESIQLVLRP